MADLLNGRYELGELLGAGGMGRVYRALDTRLQRDVAVKILRGDHVADETARARLRAEAQIAGGLNHPGIAQIYDYAEDAASDDLDPFIVMQYVEGTPLSQILRDRGKVSPREAERLLADVADALSVAHAAGIVHRDLKPANILITPDDRAVLVDFGIAASPSREPLTATGSIIGTSEYLSPEQASGRAATPASDVYALGLVAYTAITGSSAFRRDTHVASAIAQIQDALPPLDPAVPSSLSNLVVAMTSKDPEERPTAAALPALLVGGPANSVLPDGPTTVAADPQTAPMPLVAPLTSAPDRRRLLAVVGGVAALALVAVALVALLSRGPSETTVPMVVGDTAEQAAKELDTADLKHRQIVSDHPTAKAGTVIAQSPGQSKTVEEGSVITIRVASGRMRVAASELRGKSAASVQAALENLGFVVTTTNVTSTADVGTVTALSRSGRLPIGTTITLSVAKAAPAPTVVAKEPVKATTPGKSKGKGKGKKGKG